MFGQRRVLECLPAITQTQLRNALAIPFDLIRGLQYPGKDMHRSSKRLQMLSNSGSVIFSSKSSFEKTVSGCFVRTKSEVSSAAMAVVL